MNRVIPTAVLFLSSICVIGRPERETLEQSFSCLLLSTRTEYEIILSSYRLGFFGHHKKGHTKSRYG